MSPTTIGMLSLIGASAFVLFVGRALRTGKADFKESRELRIRREERPLLFWFFTACYAAMGALMVANAVLSFRQGS
jgi:hypothetical protein